MDELFKMLKEGHIDDSLLQNVLKESHSKNEKCVDILDSQEFITLRTADLKKAMAGIAQAGLEISSGQTVRALVIQDRAFSALLHAVLEAKE